MIDWQIYHPTSTLLSPFDKAAPFQLSHPEINLPVYSLPGWNKVVNAMVTTVEDAAIVLTLLPNMTIRCCIPTPQIPTFSTSDYMKPFQQIDMTLFATWACQANHLIHDLPINIMDLQTKYQNYWMIGSNLDVMHSLFWTGKRRQNPLGPTIYGQPSTFICFVP
ncbi:hypothetical protein C8J56DRAFT_81160 [Mycena floridula]|nr:hypothetical protein C8J56DRAFT_81160 [Mycena floridula]